MAKSKNTDKKPTMKEVKIVINNILLELEKMQRAILQLDSIIYGYVDFREDTNDYKKWITQKAKEMDEERKANGSDAGDNTVTN